MLCNRLQSPKATAVSESYRQHSRSSVASFAAYVLCSDAFLW
jgi:hypothetical protein